MASGTLQTWLELTTITHKLAVVSIHNFTYMMNMNKPELTVIVGGWVCHINTTSHNLSHPNHRV